MSRANTHGMPNARHIRRKTEHEKLYAADWRVESHDERGVFLKHPKVPGHTLTREAAVTLQAAWDAKREAEDA